MQCTTFRGIINMDVMEMGKKMVVALQKQAIVEKEKGTCLSETLVAF
jgi:hypothetical protein